MSTSPSGVGPSQVRGEGGEGSRWAVGCLLSRWETGRKQMCRFIPRAGQPKATPLGRTQNGQAWALRPSPEEGQWALLMGPPLRPFTEAQGWHPGPLPGAPDLMGSVTQPQSRTLSLAQ